MVRVTVDAETDRESISVQSNHIHIQFADGSATSMSILEWRELNTAVERAVGAHDAAMEFAPDKAPQ